MGGSIIEQGALAGSDDEDQSDVGRLPQADFDGCDTSASERKSRIDTLGVA